MKEKRWILREDYDKEVVKKLAEALGVDEIIATLLVFLPSKLGPIA